MQHATGKKVQYAKSATGEECKSKTLQRVKVQHEIYKYIKRLYIKKSATRKKIQNENCAIWGKCNIENVQRGNSAT